MKKTLIALMALAGVALADTPVNLETTIKANSLNGGREYYGFCLELDGKGIRGGEEMTYSGITTTQVGSSEAYTLPAELLLDSITITTRNGDAILNDVKIAVFNYVGDSQIGSLVALSDDSTGTTERNHDYTLTFSDTMLKTDARYQFLFVAADTTAGDLTDLDSYKTKAQALGLTVYNNGNIPSGWGIYKASALNDWEGNYLPKLTIATHTTPEPATATLSLLALAGLAARRRRK